jgi:uncharacterized membrane protein SirB2
MADHEEIVPHPDFRDRKTGLVVFGILEIILGGICALMTLGMIFIMIGSTVLKKSSAAQMSSGMMISGALLYAMLTVWFIWMGIGSIKARRWARALLLVSSWLWLIGGIGGLIIMLMFMPDMYDKMAQSGKISEKMAEIIKYVMLGFMAFIYIVIPGALVLFYGNRNVKATCEFRDPQIRWTDKCPLPVLAVSLMCGLWAVLMLNKGFYGWVMPFFGYIVSGMAGAGVALISMLLLGYIAWGTYKLNIKAWWCAVLVTIVWSISMGITYLRMNLFDFYKKMNFSDQQLEIMKQYITPHYFMMVLLFGVCFVVGFLGYLLYIRRYFAAPSTQEGGS